MERSKFLLASRGIIGGIIPVIFGGLMLAGFEVDSATQAEAVKLGNSLLDTVFQAIDGITLVVAGVLSLWSRLRSERRPLRVVPGAER